MNSSVTDPRFKIGDRVKLSADGIKIKSQLHIRSLRPKTPWPDRRGTITGQGARKKYPSLWTVKWDDKITKDVFHERYIETA
jgi:hypothetical protein